jgi:hypothetical protein
MDTMSRAIRPEGPILDVFVGLAAHDVRALRHAGRPIPAPVSARALIDTGADVTCIDPGVLNHVIVAGTPPGRFVLTNIPAAGGLTVAPEFAVSLTVTHPSGDPKANLVLRALPVLQQDLNSVDFQVLIGRDVLTRCLFVYDGTGRQFTLCY